MRVVLTLALVLTAPVTAEPVIVLRGDSLAAARPQLRDDVAAYAGRVSACLKTVGVTARVLSDRNLSAASLQGAALAILPYNRLDQQQVAALESFVAGGGRVLAFFTTGSERLGRLLGLRVGELRKPEYEGELAQITFADDARARLPGLPAAIAQNSWNAFVLTPEPGTTVLGAWGSAPGAQRAAVTENAAGWYVGHVLTPGDLESKGLFLLALAATRDPALWEAALESAWRRAMELSERVAQRWDRLAERFDLTTERRNRLAEMVFALTTKAGLMPPPSAGQAPAELLAIYRHTAGELRASLAELAVPQAGELRGLWVFSGRPIDWPKLVSQCREAGLNAIFYRVSRGASAVYPSALLPQEEGLKGRDELALAIETCHRYGLELHAWRVCYHTGSAQTEYRARLAAEGRLSVGLDGRVAPFCNPADPRNEQLERAAIREIAERYAVDGIHLDYIRYTDEPSYDYDYGPVSRREFERARGRPVARWPGDVVHGPLKRAYEQWEREHINRLVRETSSELRREHPGLIFSAAVWRNHRRYIYAIKQDWPLWLREGWLDLLVPMDYMTDTAELATTARTQVALAGGQTRVAIGIGAWLLDEPMDVLGQVEAARAAGADGFVLFSNNAPQLGEQLEILAKGACSEPCAPATSGPRARWRLPFALARKDAPAALLTTGPTPLEVELGPDWGTARRAVNGISARLFAEDPATGRTLAEIGGLVALEGSRAVYTGTFQPPAGVFQIVVRGQASAGSGKPWEFVVRGPLLEGWDAAQWEAHQQTLAPPEPTGAGPKIGVWHDGVGSDNLLAALRQAYGEGVVPIYRLVADHLARLDVVVLPQLRDVGDLDEAAELALRRWVSAGGRLLLTHDAVGYRWHPTMFSEVGRGVGLAKRRKVLATAHHPTRAAGQALEHVYGDHVTIAPAEAGQTWFRNADGAAVVVVGRLGQGTVVLDGMLTGATGGADAMPPEEVELLTELLALGQQP